ncbi:Iron-sulfur cluster assembly/repair protein ApbC [Granulibacter bethesdensis]|uniref:Iron-sulfur cluster carrier protein n=2 Tax=Granulibacter bethesdensis TaxID=364410 RepID=A0AAN0REJ2_9PROT|nr:Iron-sulfur cluster assembly/repair protein ApbC [Granulibacter bethesdensis]
MSIMNDTPSPHATPPDTQLREVLRAITDPATGKDIVSAGLIDSIQSRDGLVQVALRATRERAAEMETVRKAAETVLSRQPGIRNATVVLTAHHDAPPTTAQAAHGHGPGHGQGAQPRPRLLTEVGAVIAVASGKGGVGKSTVAVNLAVALAQMGLKAGLLDADIHGPSLPLLLGETRKPEARDGRLIPIETWGLKAMSIGFLVDQNEAMIWRGPMVMGALEQMMGQVAWGDLDVLIVDMPPGTGDAQLTMAQRVALAGAVIVSTPQDLALADARRGVAMFGKTHVPVLGIVENMSYFCCPNCGHRSEVFSHGGVKEEAERLGTDFLGEIPLLLDIRAAADSGTPVVAAAPASQAAQAFSELARRIWAKIPSKRQSGPKIVVQ